MLFKISFQNKRSSDKKGWSFRKRSERHRVLSNTVIQEAASGLKESPASAGFGFQKPDVSVSAEKTSTVQYTEEKTQLPAPKECTEEKSQLVEPTEHPEEKSQLLTPVEYTEEKSELLTPIEYTEEKSQLLASMEYTEEKSQSLTPEESKVHDSVAATTNEADDANLDESAIVVIQTAIRGFLVQFLSQCKFKNVQIGNFS